MMRLSKGGIGEVPIVTVVLIVVLVAMSVCAAANGPVPVTGVKGMYLVTDFGAKGDGVTDDTQAFKDALKAAGDAGGGVVFAPTGDYLIKGNLYFPPQVTLEGVFRAPVALYGAFTEDAPPTIQKGTTLLAVENKGNPDGKPFIFLRDDCTLKGLTIFYPEQDRKEPVPYPPCVRGMGDNCSIIDCLFVNPWFAVDFGHDPCGRHLIRGLYAQPIKTGIYVDVCLDVGRIEDVHLWPFWDIPLMKDYTLKNGTAFIFGRTDWEYVSGCFSIFFKVGFHFGAFKKPGPGNVVVTRSGADMTPCAVLVEKSQGHSGLAFGDCQFMAGIEVKDTNGGPVKFNNCGFWGIPSTTINHARVAGRGHVTFNSCHFITWDKDNEGEPCIYSNGRALTVSSCDFLNADKNQIVLGEDQQAAIIMGNLMRGGIKVENKSNGKVEMGLNVAD